MGAKIISEKKQANYLFFAIDKYNKDKNMG